MKNKNAFTLTEIIAVIVIIGIVLLIAIPVTNNLISNNKEKEYTLYVQTVEKAVLAYADMEGKIGEQTVTIKTLKEKKYLDSTHAELDDGSSITFTKTSDGKVTPDNLNLTFGNKSCTKNGCS